MPLLIGPPPPVPSPTMHHVELLRVAVGAWGAAGWRGSLQGQRGNPTAAATGMHSFLQHPPSRPIPYPLFPVGPVQPGFRYVSKLGGIAATQDYPYVVRPASGYGLSCMKRGTITMYGSSHVCCSGPQPVQHERR